MIPEILIITLLISIFIFFVIKWIVNKFKIGKQKNTKHISILITIILTPFIYVIFILIWLIPFYYQTTEFNKSEWNSNIDERYKMSEDIVESRFLISKTKDEVTQYLGNDFIKEDTDVISYKLGHIPGLFNIEFSYLVIEFKEGRVIDVSQY